MSEDDRGQGGHPRETIALFGHGDAERALLDAYRSGRIPHAWLIGGPEGIGKATLAYRLARFVLAHPDSAAAAVQRATDLSVPAEAPAARRIAGQAHSDLLVLERTLNEKGKLRQAIAVDDVRRAVPFFGSTAGEGGWRIAIVDSADQMNRESANALLKVLEEPPKRALILLVSHAPGRLLPTIRSRCRMLTLRSLVTDDVAAAAASALGRDPDDAELATAANASDGSVGRALALLEGSTLQLRQQIETVLARLPQVDPASLHSLGDKFGIADPEALATLADVLDRWFADRIHDPATPKPRLARLAEAYERVGTGIRDANTYNLDRKPVIFAVFGALAEASA